MAVTPRSAFAAAALFCILQATTAQSCRANSYFVGNTSSNGSSGLCVCNRGYACTTCSINLCTVSPSSSDWWGCFRAGSPTPTFQSYSYSNSSSGRSNASQCARMSDYCDPPRSQTQSFSSFRAPCGPDGSRAKRHIGTTNCKGRSGWQCDSSTFNRCGNETSFAGYNASMGPECDLDDDTKAALGALLWLIIFGVICCVFVIPIGVCFFCGFACFSAAGAASRKNNQQPQFNNPVANAPSVQAPPQPQGQYPPQPQGQYPPQPQGQYPPQPQGQYPPQPQGQYPPQPQGQPPPSPPQGQYPPQGLYPPQGQGQYPPQGQYPTATNA